MPYLVSLIAPRSWWGFVLKTMIVVFCGNLVAMVVVYAIHGYFPSGFSKQVVETTIIALPFAIGFLKIIAYLFDLQTELYRVAHTDVLTGLPNRRAFLDALNARLEDGSTGSLILADADRFKQVNDKYGHEGGDDCLRAIAKHLRSISSPHNHIARVGGEEFAMLVPTNDGQFLKELGTLLVAPISFVVATNDGIQVTAHITLSAGAVSLTDHVSASKVMAVADHRLYLAKAGGRAKCILTDATPISQRVSA